MTAEEEHKLAGPQRQGWAQHPQRDLVPCRSPRPLSFFGIVAEDFLGGRGELQHLLFTEDLGSSVTHSNPVSSEVRSTALGRG